MRKLKLITKEESRYYIEIDRSDPYRWTTEVHITY